jgi:hypothetical protein
MMHLPRLLLTAIAALAPLLASAQTVSLTANPTSGMSPLPVTLTWSTAGFGTGAFCTASGAWTGSRASSGTALVTMNGGEHTFTLNCTNPTGFATLSWTAPTQNTDGTTIRATAPGALAGFKLYTSTTTSGVATATPVVINDKAATSYVMANLPVGTNYFAAKAFNTEGIESAFTSQVNTVIVAPSAQASASVTVNVQPKPPVLSVVARTVYEISQHPVDGTRLARNVGTVPLGTECLGSVLVQSGGSSYYEVPASAVKFTKTPKTPVVAACEAPQV